MSIREAEERYSALLNGGVENRTNLLDMAKAFHRSGRTSKSYSKTLKQYQRQNKCSQMARLMEMDRMSFCGLQDLESALG